MLVTLELLAVADVRAHTYYSYLPHTHTRRPPVTTGRHKRSKAELEWRLPVAYGVV